MGFKPTPSQSQAITTIDCPLAVTAGAGSGKTRVLVERYLYLLDREINIGEIAAITFTKKAAQEMKDRLRLEREDLIESLEYAQISTFHSLCQRIIQEHPLQAKIDPRFRVGEEWETRILLFETIEEVVAEVEPLELLGSPSEITECTFDLYQTMLSKGDLTFTRPAQEGECAEFPLLELQYYAENVFSLTAQTALQKETLASLKEDWPDFLELLSFADDELRLEVLEIVLKLVKRIRGKLAEQMADFRASLEFAQGVILEKQGRAVALYLGEILEFVHQRYNQRKRLSGILDYNDLEQLAYQLLQDPQVRQDYNFKHLMVDEFQDTNLLQKRIVDALVKQGATLFVVGDPKQSIYRFRGADVGVFVQTKEEIRETGLSVFLEENFRSRPELIGFVNDLFEKLMVNEPIGFEKSAAARENAGLPSVTILSTPAEELLAAEARALEAEQIALKIKELVAGGDYKYEDISILFRAMTNVYIYEKALKKVGIPYVNLGGRGFYSKQEIQDVLHYFRWLEDPANKVAYFAVLRSPFYLISDEALYWISQNNLAQLSVEDRKIVEKANEDYGFLSSMAKTRPAPEVIMSLLERTDYVASTYRLLFGPQRVANIEKFLGQSWDLFMRDIYTISEQSRFLRLIAQEGHKEGEALLDAEHADVVVLRTIHGSKGLEFPVIFLPDNNASSIKNQTSRILYHPRYGITYKGMKLHEDLKEQEKQEEISESKRLLYTAITRAEERVYFCVREGKNYKDSWWSWLQVVLKEISPAYYRRISGDLPLFVEMSAQGVTTQLETKKYTSLLPQYRQVSFSVTSLMNYARCPRYYYLRYILGMPELSVDISGNKRIKTSSAGQTGLSGTKRGNIVHRVCEQIRDPKELGELVDYAAAMEGIDLDKAQKKQVMEIITPYLQSDFFRRVRAEKKDEEVYLEHEFIIPIGNYVINGLVDQVFVTKKGVEVLDLKSNWIRAKQVAEVGSSYDVQLRLYAWAMAKDFALPILSSQAYFLIPNQLYKLDIDNPLLATQRTEEWVLKTCTTIIQDSQSDAGAFPITGDCAICSQRHYCNAKSNFMQK